MCENVKIAPDGGYGWVIVFANALNNFITIPMMHCFGLIFKDTFSNLNFSATQSSLIICLNGAFGLMTGLISGTLLKIYGFRKIANCGAFLLTCGVILTSFANNFTEFIIAYGIITSLGIGTEKVACDVAMNTYFVKRRSRAASISVTVTGVGVILIPQLITLLMKYYTAQGVTLIYGGICAHSFIAALLLLPIQEHQTQDKLYLEPIDKNSDETKTTHPQLKSKSTIIRLFDLDLLKDPIFLNLLFGMGLAHFAEFNFSLLTAFILSDFGLNTDQIGYFLSTLGITDIIFRFLAPYIQKLFNQTPRIMYVFSVILLIVTRFTLFLSTNYKVLLLIALALGVAKGVRKVFMGLVIPSYVPLEKLPTASGMLMMINGIFLIIGGPFLGLIRDLTGSYFYCVIIMNCVSLTTIIMWAIEGLIIFFVNRKTTC